MASAPWPTYRRFGSQRAMRRLEQCVATRRLMAALSSATKNQQRATRGRLQRLDSNPG